MTTQEILTRVYDAAKPFAPVLTAADSRDYNAERVMRDMHERIMALAADLEAQLRREIAASRGVGNAAKIICGILKTCKAEKRDNLAYPWIDADGRQCVCDGFQAYRLRQHLPLEERPDTLPPTGVNLDKLFPCDLTGWKHLEMPSVNELRSFIAMERAQNGKKSTPIWSFGPEAPSVSAVLLLNAVTIFPAVTEILWNTLVSPLVITCEQGDGMVLPTRDLKKTMPNPATDEERKAIEAEAEQTRQRNAEARAEYEARRKEEDNIRTQSDLIDRYRNEQREALERVEKAANDADKADAMQAFNAACKSEAEAWISRFKSSQICYPDFSVELSTFENVIRKLYMGENAA